MSMEQSVSAYQVHIHVEMCLKEYCGCTNIHVSVCVKEREGNHSSHLPMGWSFGVADNTTACQDSPSARPTAVATVGSLEKGFNEPGINLYRCV